MVAEPPRPKVKVPMRSARSRRRAAGLVVIFAALIVMCAAPAAGAGGPTKAPQAGPLNPAFVKALRDPAARTFGRLPNPVTVHVGAEAGASLVSRAALPLPRKCAPKYDLRALGRLTAVKNQGDWGTCWAFANIAALESRILTSDPSAAPDYSENNLVARSGFGPFPFSLDAYTYGGYDAMAVAYFTRWAGPVGESEDPYSQTKESPSPTSTTTLKHVQGVVMLPGRKSVHDNALLKRMVMRYGAVSVGMWWDSGGYSGDARAAYYLRQSIGENHGVCIVGWNDDYSRSNFTGFAGRPPGNGAFLVRNSWSTGFGKKGYFYVSYYDRSFAFGDCTAYTRADDTSDFADNYQYDTLGWTRAVGYPGTVHPSIGWEANHFTAVATENVSAVGFYARSANTKYAVYAGSDLGALTLQATGIATLPGFVTVSLATPLPVTTGDPFVVAVRVNAPGVQLPLAVEAPIADYSEAATASPGESYVRRSRMDPWRDLTTVSGMSEANVCVKAYATK
jgi:C1A family cysteine protease